MPKMERSYVLVTSDFSGAGFALQEVNRNGSYVIVSYKPKEEVEPEKKDAYEIQLFGLVETVPLDEIMENREDYRDFFWVWDGNHNVEENEILRKEGFKVIHGGQFCYDLENDREFGVEFAESCGLTCPPSHEFMSADEGVAFLEANEDKAFVVKPNNAEDSALTQPFSRTLEPKNANLEARKYLQAMDVSDYLLQERKRGVEVNVELFFSNGVPVLAQANLEDKYRHNGDLGYPTGCALDLCWRLRLDSPLVQRTVGKFIPRLHEMKFTGFADANVIVGDNEFWFLEFCMRPGYNAHPTFFSTISEETFLQTMADLYEGIMPKVRQGFGASVTMCSDRPRTGIPIYVPETVNGHFHLFDGYREDGDSEQEYRMGGFGCEIGIATGFHYTPETALQAAMDNAHKIKFVNADFRTDCDKTDFPLSIVRRFEALETMKIV